MEAVRGWLQYLNRLFSATNVDGSILSSTFPIPAPEDKIREKFFLSPDIVLGLRLDLTATFDPIIISTFLSEFHLSVFVYDVMIEVKGMIHGFFSTPESSRRGNKFYTVYEFNN